MMDVPVDFVLRIYKPAALPGETTTATHSARPRDNREPSSSAETLIRTRTSSVAVELLDALVDVALTGSAGAARTAEHIELDSVVGVPGEHKATSGQAAAPAGSAALNGAVRSEGGCAFESHFPANSLLLQSSLRVRSSWLETFVMSRWCTPILVSIMLTWGAWREVELDVLTGGYTGGGGNSGGKRDVTALHYAAGATFTNSHFNRDSPIPDEDAAAVCAALLAHGADVVARDSAGLTPLLWARGPLVAQVLIDARSDVNAVDVAGNTALHYVAKECNDLGRNHVAALISAGATVNSVNAVGQTPADLARRKLQSHKSARAVLKLFNNA